MSSPVPKRQTHVPKHRQARHRAETARSVVGTTVAISSVAVVATGVVVSGGVMGGSPLGSVDVAQAGSTTAAEEQAAPTSGSDQSAELVAEMLEGRDEAVSRSDRREATDPAKEVVLAQEAGAGKVEEVALSDSDPRDIARSLLGDFGFGSEEFGCLDSLWTKESNWTVDADNPTSSAYGIPQSLPGEKMASAGADWATNPVTQITWGLGYIQDRYGSPCSAWSHSVANNWY